MSKHKDDKKAGKKHHSGRNKKTGLERSVPKKAKKHFSGDYDRESHLSSSETANESLLSGFSDDL